ncbi:ribosome biogenesis factor YjgA [Thalassotalea atypica]|uniref:ribosome biogenesis factor YjgA n=1 Tax=Thalassotalea atypica TaxID=2054316 RepID=UPI0025735637|nr:ribosome biogenesis factor YjgA [Thalassotalea atypica]
MQHLDNEYDDLDEELKSKTELKREMHQLQDFAVKLVKLSKHQRSKIPFTEAIEECLVLADKITNKHDALNRHMRFMARVLQDTDLAPIKQALDVMANKHQQETTKFNRLEKLCDEVIEQGSEKIEALLAEHSAMERQKLRQLVRQAGKEKAADKPGKQYKALFTYLKSHIS